MCDSFSQLLQIFFVLYTADNVTDSKAGLAISQSLILIVCLQYTIKQFSESVSLMTSVERILQYTNLLKGEPRTIHRHLYGHPKDNWSWRMSTWNMIWIIHQFWRYKINQLFLQIICVLSRNQTLYRIWMYPSTLAGKLGGWTNWRRQVFLDLVACSVKI